jgi:hypothetical protein
MKKIILIVFLANFSLSVQAEWVLYATSEPDGNEYYYESSSIKKLPNNKRRIWEYLNYANRINESKINSIKGYIELDCNDESYKLLQGTSYEENNLKGFSKNFDVDPKPVFIAPKTVRSLLLKVACK